MNDWFTFVHILLKGKQWVHEIRQYHWPFGRFSAAWVKITQNWLSKTELYCFLCLCCLSLSRFKRILKAEINMVHRSSPNKKSKKSKETEESDESEGSKSKKSMGSDESEQSEGSKSVKPKKDENFYKKEMWRIAYKNRNEPPFNSPSIQALLVFRYRDGKWVNVNCWTIMSDPWLHFKFIPEKRIWLTKHAYIGEDHLWKLSLELITFPFRFTYMMHKFVDGENYFIQTFKHTLFSNDYTFFLKFYAIWRDSITINEMGWVRRSRLLRRNNNSNGTIYPLAKVKTNRTCCSKLFVTKSKWCEWKFNLICFWIAKCDFKDTVHFYYFLLFFRYY